MLMQRRLDPPPRSHPVDEVRTAGQHTSPLNQCPGSRSLSLCFSVRVCLRGPTNAHDGTATTTPPLTRCDQGKLAERWAVSRTWAW